MWFFLIKAISGAIIGDASAEWFKKLKLDYGSTRK